MEVKIVLSGGVVVQDDAEGKVFISFVEDDARGAACPIDELRKALSAIKAAQ